MVVILGLFLLYYAILPNLVRSVSAPIVAWLPVATINECLMWAIMALGLNVVVGYAGLLGGGAALMVSVMGVGQLTAASIVPLLVALVVCMAFGAGVNMSAERLAYRRLRSAPKLAPLMTAVGISFIFRGIAQQEYINGSAQKNWPVVWGGPQVEGVFVYKLLMVVRRHGAAAAGDDLHRVQDQDRARRCGRPPRTRTVPG